MTLVRTHKKHRWIGIPKKLLALNIPSEILFSIFCDVIYENFDYPEDHIEYLIRVRILENRESPSFKEEYVWGVTE